MKKLTQSTITKLKKQIGGNELDREKLLSAIKQIFEVKAVLGFDIYRYSQFPLLAQTLIPVVFKSLYDNTITNCLNLEPLIFENKKKSDFSNSFIDLGDGGFQLFDNPLQAVIFATYFQANIQRYNSHKSREVELAEIIGNITLRYSLTYDNVYQFQNNHYGTAIINNARIIAKDKLNRFLIDDNSHRWFIKHLNGVENLASITLDDFKNIVFFKNSDFTIKKPSLLFKNKPDKNSVQILRLDIQKIGEIKSKLDMLSVHSLCLQALLFSSANKDTFTKFTISLGNLNTTGIMD